MLQDEPKNVNPDWIDNYQQLIVSNAYTALAPYIGGLGGAPSLDLVPIANTAFGNRLLVRRIVVGCACYVCLSWRWKAGRHPQASVTPTPPNTAAAWQPQAL